MTHEDKMKECLSLAQKGDGAVSPNPMVGCVIWKDGKKIGEGFHERFGGHHAEKNAINNAEKNGFSVAGATIFVSLEPCTHFGKTPPCAHLLKEKNIAEVIFAAHDTGKNSGGDKTFLQKNGIAVTGGVLENEARKQNRVFFVNTEKQRPYFLGKIAVSADGCITAKKGTATIITGSEVRKKTHTLRAQCDGILIGARTAEIDNPQLTVREVSGKNPRRIVLDPKRRLPKTLRLLEDKSTLRICDVHFALPENGDIGVKRNENEFDLDDLAQKLLARGIFSVLIEGGAKTLRAFSKNHLLDEFLIFSSPDKFSGGLSAQLETMNLPPPTTEKKYGRDHMRQYFFSHP